MKEKAHIFFLLLLATAFILVLGYLGSVLLLKDDGRSVSVSEITPPAAEDENFTFGNGEKSTANWQACRNETVSAYNEKLRNRPAAITPEDRKRHQRRLKYCDTLFP